jgi:8-oxo-dGTP pyrophosphatase MutT (NUDIX family)
VERRTFFSVRRRGERGLIRPDRPVSLRDRLRAALARPPHGLDLLPGDDPVVLPGGEAAGMRAAVLVPVVTHAEPTLLLTQRPETMRQHAGQVAFPGGRIDPEDDGPIAAALREAEEEIALPRDAVEVIGLADPYRTVTGFVITPVVGLVPPGLPLHPAEAEVAAIFEAPLAHLVNPAHQRLHTTQWQGRERRYFEINWADRRIWGATAAMIVNLSRRLHADG